MDSSQAARHLPRLPRRNRAGNTGVGWGDLRFGAWKSSRASDSSNSMKVIAWSRAFPALRGRARCRFRTGNGK